LLGNTETDFDVNNNITQMTYNTYSFSIDSTSSATANVTNTKMAFVVDTGQQVINNTGSVGALGSTVYPTIPIIDNYRPYSGRSLLVTTLVKKILSTTDVINDSVTYTYEPQYYNIKTISTRNSKGEEIQTINYYNYEQSPVLFDGLEHVTSTQRWKRTVPTTQIDQGGGVMLDGFFNGFTIQGSTYPYSKVWSKNLYNLRAGSPLSYSAYLGTGTYTSTNAKVQGVQAGAVLPGFIPTSKVLLFDLRGNPLETQLGDQEQYKAMIWDTATGQKLAEAANCHYNDIAYCGLKATNMSCTIPTWPFPAMPAYILPTL
jgi:hypothetical protein